MATLARASLTDDERRVLERFLGLLRDRLGASVEAVWLYGSRARGEPPHEQSDVDLLVVTRHGAQDDEAVSRALREAAEDGREGGFFSVQVADRAWLGNRRAIGDFFMGEIDRDKLVLMGDEMDSRSTLAERGAGVEADVPMRRRSVEFLDSAEEHLAMARWNLESEFPRAAAWAAYYAMLNAARAALSEDDRYARSHSGTWRLFGEHFVVSGRIDTEIAAPVDNIRRLRERSDYQAERPTAEQAEAAVTHAERFVNAVIGALET